MAMRAERSPHGRSARMGVADLPKRKPDLKKLWPQVWSLMAPRKGLLVLGFFLMVTNRLAGMILPLISKPLLDTVLSPNHPRADWLPRIILIVLSATLLQAITSFSLTQLLSKEGQRLIAEMRRQVQRHV